jgi:hypothetical protein
MSRGPGRIERVIEGAFRTHPSGTFTVEELVAIAYPEAAQVEKKHRVGVIRAADKVATRLWWDKAASESFHHPLVYFNKLEVHSYATMREQSETFVKATPEAIAEGGSWWLHVEAWRAEHAGQHERAKELREETARRTAEILQRLA